MKYYMAGIKGAGMSALALLLHDLGYEVVGYDDEAEHRFTEDKLIDAGIDSLKIEGRTKRPEYSYLVTKIYRKAIDNYIKYKL